MKKKIISLIALLASTSLLIGCNEEAASADNQNNNSSGNNYADVSDIFSSDPTSSSEDSGEDEIDELDVVIAEFVSDLNVKVPSVAKYDLVYEVYYYFEYGQYVISAYTKDAGNSICEEYANAFSEDTNLVSYNDDDYYTIEDYGFLFTNEDGNLVVNFMNDSGYFVLSIYRNDGLYGTLDVSEIDTNWYVDYVNLQGMEVVDAFPADEIKEFLGITASITIPGITAEAYPVLFQDAVPPSANTLATPDTVVVVLDGDQLEDYVNILKQAGYVTEIVENTGETIDWEAFEIVEYTYYTAYAYDANQNIYIDIVLDDAENTYISYCNFSDIFTTSKTTNTDWTEEEKGLMDVTLHQLLPFMAFGDDYTIYDLDDEDWTLLVLQDSYYEDLTEDYINLLLAEGFFIDDVTWEDTYYCYDNGLVYIEIFITYENGNYLEIYYENSHLEPLTDLGLNVATLDIVAGSTFQLEPVYTPASATYPVTWSSSNENIATVDNKGLVTINSNAPVDSEVKITATTLTGKSATATFVVKANVVTGITFLEDEYTVIPGGEAYVPAYSLLPYGVTTNETVTFSLGNGNNGIHYNEKGELWADSTAVEGTEDTLMISIGSFNDNVTVRVISAEVRNTLTGTFFEIKKGETNYNTYKKSVDGASYEAQAAAGNNADNGNGLQLRSKNSNSGVIGNCEGRTCKSLTFTFDSNTQAGRAIEIYASNTPFTITDMYGSSVTKVGTVNYDASNLTQTYTFTDNYSYIGFRSADGALYLKSVEVVW